MDATKLSAFKVNGFLNFPHLEELLFNEFHYRSAIMALLLAFKKVKPTRISIINFISAKVINADEIYEY